MKERKKKIIVLGSGFAALSIVTRIDPRFFEVSVVSPRNHFLFTPLLPSTTVGTIEFRSIIEPVRTAKNVRADDKSSGNFYQANCTSVSPSENAIECESVQNREKFKLDYDYLVIAVGAVNNTFGIPGVTEHALFLKELSDARVIRGRIIQNFEEASSPTVSLEERKRLLRFIVVGGGPTGVEFAAELNDLVREDLIKWYPRLVQDVEITLLEGTKQILSAFDSRLGEYAMKIFRRQSIDLRFNSPVKEVTKDSIILQDGTSISCGMVVWSTGIGPTDLIQSLPFRKGRGSRLLTDDYLRVGEARNIFTAGDCATPASQSIPATAQAAQQEGKYLAAQLNNIAKGKPPSPFKYRHLGMLAYIGSRRALADLPNVKGRGFGAFLFWRSAYLTRLVSLKNKVLVLFDWLKASVFGRDISSF